MSQAQSRRGLSLRTKLILAIVPLVTLVVGFVNLATLQLFRQDKEAYVYEHQGVQVQLLAREMAELVQRGHGFLEQILSIQGLSEQSQRQLFARQTGLKEFYVFQWQEGAGRFLSGAPESDERRTQATTWLNHVRPGLVSSSRALFNASAVGGDSEIGIALRIQDRVGLVVASLAGFGEMAKAQNVSIATLGGEALFDSDPKVQFDTRSVVSDPLYQTALNHPLAQGGKEYLLDSEPHLGSFARHPSGFIALSRTQKSRAMQATYLVVERSLILSVLGVGIALILAVVFARSLTASLSVLQQATTQVAAGVFDAPINVRSNDEVGDLAFAFRAMAERIKELIVEQMEKVRLEGEVAIASTVQQTLFPPEYVADQNVEIQSLYRSASQCGGDWWGTFRVGSKVVFLIADATGHGIPSALVTAAARSCFSVLQKLAVDAQEFPVSPSLFLSFANQAIHEAALGKIMMTFFVGVADFETKTFTYGSGGHNPPWLFRAKADGTFKSQSLVAKGPRLGESQYVPAYEEKTVPIANGDILVLYTDGLLEDKDPAGTQYGKKRARHTIEEKLGEGPKGVLTHLMRDFMAFNGSKSLDDDVTLAVVRFKV